MPALMASRGLAKAMSWPLTLIWPELGLWTPAMVLMKVDLPAPLSPKRQWHSPGMTETETPLRAMTGPKLLVMSISSIRGVFMLALPGDQATDIGVQHHGQQQDDAEEDPEQRAFNAGEEQPLLHHAKDQRTQRRADDRAIAAGEQRPADHHG